MSILSEVQLRAANWLLNHSDGRPEDQIIQRIQDILRSLDIDYESSWVTPNGPADIYLPRRRTIIETKALKLADDPDKPQYRKGNESPKEQLERYLHAEIDRELMDYQLQDSLDRQWTGILTDGRVWHVWHYPHAENAQGTALEECYRPQSPEALVERLRYFLKGQLVGKPWIPADPHPLFEPFLFELRDLYAELRAPAAQRTETKMLLWLEMLRTSSMEPDNAVARQRLFVAHSFLVVLARGVIRVLANPSHLPSPGSIVGDGFVSWIVDTNKGKQWVTKLLREIQKYEWRRRPGDVLRPLYEQFVGINDRKAFGEYYTPDWLAELVVEQICDDAWCDAAVDKAISAIHQNVVLKGVGVLDPTCGSGTFLYHAANRILKSRAIEDLANSHKASVVCALVHGIDVHPVAAEIARATLLRALPADPPHGESSLNIHEGDALLIRSDDENSLFRPNEGYIRIATPKGAAVLLPSSFVERPDFSDALRRLVLAAAEERPFPPGIVDTLSERDQKAIEVCFQNFVEIIKDEGNSVWTWYIRNTTGPYRLSETKVNRIVANPPWVKMADIQAINRKRDLERFAASQVMDLWSGGKQAPHFDIAQLFVKRCRQLYLTDPSNDPAAWLVKKSALKADHWSKFRSYQKKYIKQTLDLEPVQPFGGGDARRCCVLFEGGSSSLRPRGKRLVATLRRNTERLRPNMSLETARERISFRVVPAEIPRAISGYVTPDGTPLFRQGATITPKVLTVLDRVAERGKAGQLEVTTVRSMHRPWSEIELQTGSVPSTWIRELIVSKAVLPFALSPSAQSYALIPVDSKGNFGVEATKESSFWQRLNSIYRENRGRGRGTPRDLISQIDYGSKLSGQLHLSGNLHTMVIYPSSGDIMRACRVRPGEAIIDATLYRFTAESASEAAYLVALMNTPCLSETFAHSRDSGRDFHLNPWRRIPIVRFDPQDKAHVELSRLAVQAERITKKWLANPHNPVANLGQVGLSTRLRNLLVEEGVFAEMDRIAHQILPKHVRRKKNQTKS